MKELCPKENLQRKIVFDIKGATKPSIKHSDHHNEDRMFILKESVGVFDGVGGVDDGEKAAEIAKNSIERDLQKLPKNLDIQSVISEFKNTIRTANNEIYNEAQKTNRTMETTASVVYIWGRENEKKLIVGNIGNSRVYLLKDKKLEQITLDDDQISLKYPNEREARQLQSKLNNVTGDNYEQLNEEEKNFFINRNYISQSLGMQSIAIRLNIVDFSPSDKVLICSDGIFANITDNEIKKIMDQNKNSEEIVQDLMMAAQKRSEEITIRSSKDDMTAIVVQYKA